MENLKKIFQVLLLVCLFVIPGCRRVEYRSVQPENSDMKYLLFPAESYQNTLKRAIIVSGKELCSNGKISYYVGDNEVMLTLPAERVYGGTAAVSIRSCV